MSELESFIHSPPKTTSIQPRVPSSSPSRNVISSLLAVYAAIAIELAVVAFLIVVVFVDIYITRPGLLSTRVHALYITGTTIVATVIASFASGQLRTLWLGTIRHDISHRKENTLLAIGKWRDQFRYWPITVSFLITGLTTTAIVAGITPSTGLFWEDTWLTLWPADDGCSFVNSTKSDGGYNWLLPNGSYFQVNRTQNIMGSCADQEALSLAKYIQGTYGHNLAYVMSRTGVFQSAIGTPFQSGSDIDFSSTFGVWGEGWDLYLLQSATACFPIFEKNPVQCTPSGYVTTGINKLNVEANACNITSPIFGVDPTTQGATASGACTPGAIGQVQLVIGAVNRHANLLAQVLYDRQAPAPESYSVICEVDIAPAIAYRTITYARHTSEGIFNEMHEEYTVTGGAECTPGVIPPSEIISDSVLAMGAAAAGQMFTENAYNDGWWSTLWEATQSVSNSAESTDNFSFNNSRNPLEEVLGLVSAMVVGAHLGATYGDGSYVNMNGMVSSSALRVGPGELWALVYIVPQIYTILLLVYFLWKRPKS